MRPLQESLEAVTSGASYGRAFSQVIFLKEFCVKDYRGSEAIIASISCPETVCHAPLPVVSFSHHYDVLGKRLVPDSTDRENHFLSRFENVTIYNVGRNEGNLGTVRTINNSKPLRVNFLHHSRHFVGSPRATLALEIKTIDDEIAECTQKDRKGLTAPVPAFEKFPVMLHL